MRKAINLIVILLVILIALLIAIIIISSKTGTGTGGSETNTGEPSVSTNDPDSTTDQPSSTDDGTTIGDTTANGETTAAPDTSKSPDTSTADGAAPDGFILKKSISSETGTALNLRADVRGETDAATGKVKVTVLLYIDYRSFYLGERKNCRISLGDTSEIFNVPAISEDDNSEHTQFIASVERLCDYGETLSLYAKVPFRGTYSDVEIDSLEIDTSITVK